MNISPKINLFYNRYDNKDRQGEIDYCLFKNIEVFDRVIVFKERFTIGELFEMSKAYPDDINCYCNSDVYFTEDSIKKLYTINKDECYALTRNDMIHHKDAKGSQDAWVFRGVVREMGEIDFYLGMYGVDNRLAYELKKVGYNLMNPAFSIELIHVHETDEKLVNGQTIRTSQNTVPPPYQLLPLTTL